MSRIHPWLIRATAFILQNPKCIIILPLLSIFLCAYSSLYDFTLRPLNGPLVSHFDNTTLDTGLDLKSVHAKSFLPLPDVSGLNMVKYSLSNPTSVNTLKYDFVCEIEQFQAQLESQSVVALSPISMWPFPCDPDLSVHDKEKMERFMLKNLNHHLLAEVIKLFFGDMKKRNHLIYQAGLLNIFAFFKPDVPPLLPNSSTIELVALHEGDSSKASADFSHYYASITGKNPLVNIVTYLALSVQACLFSLLIVHCYLSVANQHKIRSTFGLLIGWLTSVFISAFAALFIVGRFQGVSIFHAFGPVNSVSLTSYLLSIMLLSSRNLFRTINDLAGDNAFGAPENLHKRLIKFYLGINNSVQNSRGVFKITRFLRRNLFLDKFAAWVFPIPNTTVILLINDAAFHALLCVLKNTVAEFMDENHKQIFVTRVTTLQRASVLALFIDHFLQLTYLVGLIVIDLNRVDLTDLLKLLPLESDDDSGVHEMNPISSFLLGVSEKKPTSPNTWRYRLGTYCLKVSPVSLKRFLGLWIPVVTICLTAVSILLIMLVIPNESVGFMEVIGLRSLAQMSQRYDYLFVIELLAGCVLVFAIAELTFIFTHSKKQDSNAGLDALTALISPDSGLTNKELVENDKVKFFECLSLSGTHKTDILKLVSNPKCSFLVSTDLDHKVLIWSPLSKVESSKPQNIATFFESSDPNAKKAEFWPVNHIEISDDGNYIVLINNKHCRIKCFERKSLTYVWEVSLTSELNQSRKKMHVVNAFFRKKTVAGFLARKLLLKRKQHTRRSSSVSSNKGGPLTGNYPPPSVTEMEESRSENSEKNIDKELIQEEFVLVLETGEMITVACHNIQIKVYNLLTQLYEGQPELRNLKIISLKFLKTARVNDRVVCNLSNDDIIVGTAVNNLWRFQKLDLDVYYSSTKTLANFAPPLMSRTGSAISFKHDFSTAFELQRQTHMQRQEAETTVFSDLKKYQVINKSTVITIDFVGMIVRVKDLLAELIDVQTGTVLKVFGIGHFKPDTFRVAHSEPTHCKFCGCASFESLSLVYEDFYDKTIIMHTFTVENKKSRNNICLRVERDPREIRCVGLDSAIEKQYWYEDIEKWEVTDMNVILGIRKISPPSDKGDEAAVEQSGFSLSSENGLSSLRTRKKSAKAKKEQKHPTIDQLWQGIVITAQNGKLLEYNIPANAPTDAEFSSTRPNYIVKYGFKSVAIAFGSSIKILYLGGDKLIENDLYYSGTTSTLNSILKPNTEGAGRNELLFINKRRRMLEKRNAKASRTQTELPNAEGEGEADAF